MLIISRNDDNYKHIARTHYMRLIKNFVEDKVPEIEQDLIEIMEMINSIFILCNKKYSRLTRLLKNEYE